MFPKVGEPDGVHPKRPCPKTGSSKFGHYPVGFVSRKLRENVYTWLSLIYDWPSGLALALPQAWKLIWYPCKGSVLVWGCGVGDGGSGFRMV